MILIKSIALKGERKKLRLKRLKRCQVKEIIDLRLYRLYYTVNWSLLSSLFVSFCYLSASSVWVLKCLLHLVRILFNFITLRFSFKNNPLLSILFKNRLGCWIFNCQKLCCLINGNSSLNYHLNKALSNLPILKALHHTIWFDIFLD